MVIDARRIFGCTHTFVGLMDAGIPLFTCASCGYRTEFLPLPKRATSAEPAASKFKRARTVRAQAAPKVLTRRRVQ